MACHGWSFEPFRLSDELLIPASRLQSICSNNKCNVISRKGSNCHRFVQETIFDVSLKECPVKANPD